jgi:hypothetical protein
MVCASDSEQEVQDVLETNREEQARYGDQGRDDTRDRRRQHRCSQQPSLGQAEVLGEGRKVAANEATATGASSLS